MQAREFPAHELGWGGDLPKIAVANAIDMFEVKIVK